MMGSRAGRSLMLLAVLAMLVCAGCPDDSEPEAISELGQDVADDPDSLPPPDMVEQAQKDRGMIITSSAFKDGRTIPVTYTADGENISPPLQFSKVPQETTELALIMHDPDAPMEGGFTHWVVYGMPPDTTELPEDIPTEPTVEEPALAQGVNSADETGYIGPAPPEGDEAHHYNFTLYALSEGLDLEPGATKDELESAMEDRIVAETTLTGMYGR